MDRLPAFGEPSHRAPLAGPGLLSRSSSPRTSATRSRAFYTLFYHRAPDERAARRACSATGSAGPLTPPPRWSAGTRRRGATRRLRRSRASCSCSCWSPSRSAAFPVARAMLVALLWSTLTGHRRPAAADARDRGLPRARPAYRSPRSPVGAALAAAGAAYQGLFRNPLVSPDILGVSSGAALGAVLGIYLSLGVVGDPGPRLRRAGLAAVACRSTPSARRSAVTIPILVLVLAGIVVGTLLGSCVSLLKYLADPVQPAPGDHLLAPRQPGRRHARRRAGRSLPGWSPVGLVPLLSPPVADERDDAQRGRGARARRGHPARAPGRRSWRPPS